MIHDLSQAGAEDALPLQTVMLVDDNPLDNEFHEIVLKKAGFRGRLFVCETGEEAVEFFSAERADAVQLLLLDINLPGITGFDVARTISELAASRPELVVVMLTSSPDPQDVETALSVEIVRDYMTKPLTVVGLRDLVQRHKLGRPATG